MNKNFTKVASFIFALVFSCSIANAKIFGSKKAAPEQPATPTVEQPAQPKKQVVKEIINDTIEVRVVEPAAVTDETAKETVEGAKEDTKETTEAAAENTVKTVEEKPAQAATTDKTVETTVIKEEAATTIFNVVKPEIEVKSEQPAVGEKAATDAVKAETKEEVKTETTAEPAPKEDVKETK